MNGPFEICPGDTVDLLVSASGGYGTYYYNWSTTETTPQISVAPQVSTSYFVQVSDECQTFSTAAVATVQVVKPLANFYILTQAPMQGLPVQLENASMNAWSYTWSFGDGNGSFLVNPTHAYVQPGQYEITLIELYPCSSRDELRARERFHVEQNVCVNKNMPGRGVKESVNVAVKKWRKNHTDDYKAYYQKLNDKVKEYNAFSYQLRQIPKRMI
jgi:hypothetical protein